MSENIEDSDDCIDIEAAARFRQLLRLQSQATFDSIHQSMLEIQQLAEDAGIGPLLDYDRNIDDLELDIF